MNRTLKFIRTTPTMAPVSKLFEEEEGETEVESGTVTPPITVVDGEEVRVDISLHPCWSAPLSDDLPELAP